MTEMSSQEYFRQLRNHELPIKRHRVKTPPQTSRKFTNVLSPFPNEFEGEDAFSSDDEYQKNRVTRNKEGEGESSDLNQKYDALRALRTNPVVVSCLKKLTQLHEKEDAKRFANRADSSKLEKDKSKRFHFLSDCCLDGESKSYASDDGAWESDAETLKGTKSQEKLSYGPFRSCPIRHTRSHDFDTMTEKTFIRKTSEDGLAYGSGTGMFQTQFSRPATPSRPVR